MSKQFNHTPVLASEVAEMMALSRGDLAVDCTAGGGGHTTLMLQAVGEEGRAIAIDQDPDAIAHLKNRFASEIAAKNLQIASANFSNLKEILNQLIDYSEPTKMSILADLGVSSHQLDTSSRGFSINKDAPLDMRMDQTAYSGRESALEFINSADEDMMVDILYRFGEEPKARQIARGIIRSRENSPIKTTTELAEIISGLVHYRERSKIHPATRTFQAIRMHINNELPSLQNLLHQATDLLSVPGSRLAVISFHSLEDRMVKHFFQTLAGTRGIPSELKKLPLAVGETKNHSFRIIKPFPTVPSPEEIARNPRSRSSKLRVIERV